MELEPRDVDTIGAPNVFFSGSPFLTGGRWTLRGKQRGCYLLAPALLASELWAVLGWLVPARERDYGRRRRFSAAPRAHGFSFT